jgi:hypothetical protein
MEKFAPYLPRGLKPRRVKFERPRPEVMAAMETVVQAILEDKSIKVTKTTCYQVLQKYALSRVELRRLTQQLQLNQQTRAVEMLLDVEPKSTSSSSSSLSITQLNQLEIFIIQLQDIHARCNAEYERVLSLQTFLLEHLQNQLAQKDREIQDLAFQLQQATTATTLPRKDHDKSIRVSSLQQESLLVNSNTRNKPPKLPSTSSEPDDDQAISAVAIVESPSVATSAPLVKTNRAGPEELKGKWVISKLEAAKSLCSVDCQHAALSPHVVADNKGRFAIDRSIDPLVSEENKDHIVPTDNVTTNNRTNSVNKSLLVAAFATDVHLENTSLEREGTLVTDALVDKNNVQNNNVFPIGTVRVSEEEETRSEDDNDHSNPGTVAHKIMVFEDDVSIGDVFAITDEESEGSSTHRAAMLSMSVVATKKGLYERDGSPGGALATKVQKQDDSIDAE